MKRNNTTIYSSATSLFITSGDHNSIEITGTELAVAERILLALGTAEPLHAEVDDDRDYFNDLIT